MRRFLPGLIVTGLVESRMKNDAVRGARRLQHKIETAPDVGHARVETASNRVGQFVGITGIDELRLQITGALLEFRHALAQLCDRFVLSLQLALQRIKRFALTPPAPGEAGR